LHAVFDHYSNPIKLFSGLESCVNDTQTTFCVYPDFSEENLFEQFKDALLNAGYFDELATPYTDPLEKAKIAFKGVLKVKTFNLFIRYI
jgi:hypothetical protein